MPGIEPSPDKLLQGRLFSYPDTQRHRLGPNYALIPVNCPHARGVHNYQRDGAMRTDANGGSTPNYSPNGRGGPIADPTAPSSLVGATGRSEYPQAERADDFEQAGLLYRVLKADERARLVKNIAGHLGHASVAVQERQVEHFVRADAEYGAAVKAALGLGRGSVAPG